MGLLGFSYSLSNFDVLSVVLGALKYEIRPMFHII